MKGFTLMKKLMKKHASCQSFTLCPYLSGTVQCGCAPTNSLRTVHVSTVNCSPSSAGKAAETRNDGQAQLLGHRTPREVATLLTCFGSKALGLCQTQTFAIDISHLPNSAAWPGAPWQLHLSPGCCCQQ